MNPIHAIPSTQPYFTVAQIKEAQEELGLTQAEFGRKSGVSASIISGLYSGAYKGDQEKYLRELTNCIRTLHERNSDRSRLPEIPSFIMTDTAESIAATLQQAQNAHVMVEVAGHPGAGKTTTCEWYAKFHPNTWLVTMAPYTSGVVPCLETIAESMGLPLESGARRLAVAIQRKARDTDGLFIIDEAQHLSVQALDAVRSIHDAAKVGMALVGSESLRGKLRGKLRGAEQTAQLFSRIRRPQRVGRPTLSDVMSLCAAWGIESKAEVTFAHEIAQKPGALRGLSTCLQLACLAANAEQRGIKLNDLRDAWASLGGVE